MLLVLDTASPSLRVRARTPSGYAVISPTSPMGVARAVSVDVVDVFGVQFGVLRERASSRAAHPRPRARAAPCETRRTSLRIRRSRQMMSAPSRDGARSRSSSIKMPGALGNDEAVAPRIERAARQLGLVVAPRQRSHGRKRSHAHRRHRRFRAARHGSVDLTSLNPLERITDGMGTRRARAGVRVTRPLETPIEGHLPRERGSKSPTE